MQQFDSPISTGEARELLNRLELLTLHHDEWVSSFLRAIICDEPLDDALIGSHSHQTCRFGCWLEHDIHDLGHHPWQ